MAWCAGLAVAALAIGPRAALGVLGGGAIAAVSYWALKRGVEAVVDPGRRRDPRRQAALNLLLFTGRYALLAGIAYVMIARLRLHPVGLLVGASSLVLAIATEALRRR